MILNEAVFAQETTTYVLTDPQGTVLAETDAHGNITARYDYRPYGGQVSGPRGNGPGYTGHVVDADTGLVYMQARYYDPVGRMLSVDPVVPEAGDILGFNRYAYAYNNPIKYTDPDGRCPICIGIVLYFTMDYANAPGPNDTPVSMSSGDKLNAIANALPPGKAISVIRTTVNIGKKATATVKSAAKGQSVDKASDQGPRFATGNLRKQVMEKGRQADGTVKCAYCDKPTATQSDHVTPYSKGGPTKIENLEPACPSCNASKGSRELRKEWVPPKEREDK